MCVTRTATVDVVTVWSFPTRSRCPACGSVDTRADTTRGAIQYRKCRACGHRYHERGSRV